MQFPFFKTNFSEYQYFCGQFHMMIHSKITWNIFKMINLHNFVCRMSRGFSNTMSSFKYTFNGFQIWNANIRLATTNGLYIWYLYTSRQGGDFWWPTTFMNIWATSASHCVFLNWRLLSFIWRFFVGLQSISISSCFLLDCWNASEEFLPLSKWPQNDWIQIPHINGCSNFYL